METPLFKWIIPVRLRSEANICEHWTVKVKRQKRQKLQVRAELNGIHNRIQLPCKIVLTRISPRLLEEDNNISAFKHIRDQVADCILPGMAYGRADADPRLKWEWKQEKSKQQAISIEIYPE